MCLLSTHTDDACHSQRLFAFWSHAAMKIWTMFKALVQLMDTLMEAFLKLCQTAFEIVD